MLLLLLFIGPTPTLAGSNVGTDCSVVQLGNEYLEIWKDGSGEGHDS